MPLACIIYRLISIFSHDLNFHYICYPFISTLCGYAYGMGGLETMSYDKEEKILYGISEQGFVTLIDQSNAPEEAPQLPIVVQAEGPTLKLGGQLSWPLAAGTNEGNRTPPLTLILIL